MDKSPDAFRTISEVAEELDLPQHVLRFWETRFSHIRPLKRGGGRRYYRPDDVDLLKGIRHLLYGEGYTIKGVQRILKSDGARFVQSVGRGDQSVAPPQSDSGGGSRVEQGGQAEPAYADGPVEETDPRLGALDVSRLQEVLDELVECDRLLNTLRATSDGVTSE
jgi:DNA-binding transcriptional MerR regulator